MCAKFWFRSIPSAEVYVANESFSTGKPIRGQALTELLEEGGH